LHFPHFCISVGFSPQQNFWTELCLMLPPVSLILSISFLSGETHLSLIFGPHVYLKLSTIVQIISATTFFFCMIEICEFDWHRFNSIKIEYEYDKLQHILYWQMTTLTHCGFVWLMCNIRGGYSLSAVWSTEIKLSCLVVLSAHQRPHQPV